MNWSATTRLYTKPEQAASRLNAGQLLILSFSCTRQATFGKIKSGVVVPTTTRSMSFGSKTGVLERGEPSPVGEVAGRFVVCGDVAILDAGATPDPLVRGLDHLLEIRVGEDAFR